MSEELKTCPFCGSEAKIMEKEIGDYLDTFYDVRCTNDECYLEGGADWVFGTKEEVIEKWNTRHKDQRIAELEAENKQFKRTLGHTEAALADWGDTGIDELRLKVTDLEAELAKYRWIPVGDRLPEKFGRYLVINSAGGYRFSRISVYHPDIKQFSTRLVSHWMEIPELKGESNDS